MSSLVPQGFFWGGGFDIKSKLGGERFFVTHGQVSDKSLGWDLFTVWVGLGQYIMVPICIKYLSLCVPTNE